ncbi:caldesmon-like isoform X3 [Ovis canadensis]|uniref:caldesmon-like isoform X3 n=1 Tax=Ovis canadensis TaxID=37174 RepID=UPI0037507771
MSDRRKSSAPLSSRTQQWALEDKEEQERERRRRLWNLRFTTDDEDLPAPESTRMRLPASSVKLGLKVEQYLSAIQRSESVMYANPFHTEFPVAPVDVTSKRHLFKKELLGQSQEDPASSHKNQETQRELEAGSKPQWRKTPEAPLGAEVSSPSTEAEAKSPSPTVALPTFSSSLQHSSPHTISFRMSPRRDSSEAALTRSTSMRLPASSVKLGLKVEQYLSAIQRSESIRYANPFHTEFPVAPVDVTSKRHLFEKEQVGQSQEDPASSCKENLQLSGVKSRLNLWMSRAQESAQQGPQNQETQRELEAGSKPQWRKTPEALLGAEKISVLEERAVSGKRAVPDKASDSEKRPVSEKATVFEKTPVPEMQPAPGRAMAPVWPQDWEHSASAEYPSSPRRLQGTGPEKEPESSAGPLPRAGGLPPVTLQVHGAPHLPVLPASLVASLSSWHLWRPPCLLSSHLLSSRCLWLPPFLLSSSLQAGPSSVSPPCLLCCPQDRGLGWGLTWQPHHTLTPGPDSREASDASRSSPIPGSPVHWPGPGPVPPQPRQQAGAEDRPAATAPWLMV